MMEKIKLNRFISKYFLNGNVESVVWKSNGKSITTKFIDATQGLVGEVSCDNIDEFPEMELGINQTSKLKSLLNVLGDNVDMDFKKNGSVVTSISVSDANVDVNYVLSDISIMPKVPTVKSMSTWNLILHVDEKFIDNFIKACNALNTVKEFAVVSKNELVSFVVGYSSSNTNKVAVSIQPKTYSDTAVVYFSTLHLKEILLANKDAKVGKIEVNDKGLMRVSFNVDDYKCIYYLLAKQQLDDAK